MSLLDNRKTFIVRPDVKPKERTEEDNKRKESRKVTKSFTYPQLETIRELIIEKRKIKYHKDMDKADLNDNFFRISDEILNVIHHNIQVLSQPARPIIPKKRRPTTIEEAEVNLLKTQAQNKLNEQLKPKEEKEIDKGGYEI